MRVLLAGFSYPPDAASLAARVAEGLARQLVAVGDTVAVVARRPGPAPMPPRIYTEHRSGVMVHWLAGGDAVPPRRDGETQRLFGEILDAFVPDVLHVLDVEDGPPDAIAAARRRGIPAVADSHPVPGCVLFDPASASSGPRTTPEERGSLVLATIGEVRASAGLETVLEALRLADLGPVELLVLGRVVDHPLARGLRALAEPVAGLALELFGKVEAHELPGLLADVDCVLIPSEPSRSTAADIRHALACGVPVACAFAGGPPDPARTGSAVLPFDRGGAHRLGEILQRVGGDPAFLARLREAARSTPVLGPLAHARAVRRVYDEVLAANG